MSDNTTPFPGTKQVQEFNLTEEQRDKIQSAFQKMKAVEGLIASMTEASNEFVLNKLIDQYTSLKVEYDQWFVDFALENDLTTSPTQGWNIDFANKKAQLIG